MFTYVYILPAEVNIEVNIGPPKSPKRGIRAPQIALRCLRYVYLMLTEKARFRFFRHQNVNIGPTPAIRNKVKIICQRSSSSSAPSE